MPDYFKTSTTIEGMLATDIFTLNAALGATIEEQVVNTLNDLRPVWDPNKRYQTYSFVRQPQTFPDVLLRKRTDGQDILLVELKGWYLLAKEAMPTFRFVATPAVCNPWDLIVVVPWALLNVLAGSPVAYTPFIDLARYAAEQRNYYWQYERETTDDPRVHLASADTPYSTRGNNISDRAAYDPGGNFGRLARYGIMQEYVREMLRTKLRGIAVEEWLRFLKRHAVDTGN